MPSHQYDGSLSNVVFILNTGTVHRRNECNTTKPILALQRYTAFVANLMLVMLQQRILDVATWTDS